MPRPENLPRLLHISVFDLQWPKHLKNNQKLIHFLSYVNLQTHLLIFGGRLFWPSQLLYRNFIESHKVAFKSWCWQSSRTFVHSGLVDKYKGHLIFFVACKDFSDFATRWIHLQAPCSLSPRSPMHLATQAKPSFRRANSHISRWKILELAMGTYCTPFFIMVLIPLCCDGPTNFERKN